MRIGRCIGMLVACGLLSACGGSGAPPPTPAPTALPTQRPILAAVPSRVASPSPSPSVSAKALVYVAIGASDTVGVGAADPARDGWGPQLARMLGAGTDVRNLGVSGTLTHAARTDQLPTAVRAQPDLVTVWFAVNDLNAGVPVNDYWADLDAILATLADQTHAVVLVANVPDLSLVPQYRDQ